MYINIIQYFFLLNDYVQRKIFSKSPYIYLVSKGMLYELSTLYPEVNFRILTHSLPKYQFTINNSKTNLNQSNKIVLTFLGNINNSNIDALRYTITALEKQEVIINLITSTPNNLLKREGLIKNNVNIKNNIEDQNILNELNKSNFLLLPHGFKGSLSKAEYRSVFPTKTLQYLQSTAPILALLPSDSYLYKFLTENQCAFCVTKKNKQDILSIIKILKYNKNEIIRTVNNANKVAEKFSANTVLIRIRNEILN